MSFKTKKYIIVKSAVSNDIAKIAYNYLLIKRNSIAYMFEQNYLAPFDKNYGTWNDSQVPNTYSVYADALLETLLLYVKPKMIEVTKLKLYESYSYARTYKKGDILKKHIDRPSCEISTTLFLGGDKWPIYLKDNKKTIEVNLDVGDMLIYKGCELEHWRNAFDGEVCVQTFLHYTTNQKLLYDGRPMLGLNSDFIKIKKNEN
jgi:hypothetical protein